LAARIVVTIYPFESPGKCLGEGARVSFQSVLFRRAR
jgi:hypothetical protein